MNYIDMKEFMVIVAVLHFIATCWACHVFYTKIKKEIDAAVTLIIHAFKKANTPTAMLPGVPVSSMPPMIVPAPEGNAKETGT